MSEPRELLTLVALANPVPDLEHLDVDEVAVAEDAVETAWGAQRGVTVPGPGVRRVPRLRPVLAFVAAALLLLVLVGLPALIGSIQVPVVDEPATTSVTTTIAPATTVPPTTTQAPPAFSMTLERLPLDPVFEGATPVGIAAGGPGLVVVGSVDAIIDVANFTLSTAGASWWSSDGYTWQRGGDLAASPGSSEPFNVRPGGGSATGRAALAAGSAGMVVTGTIDEFTSALWASPDGISWTLVSDDDLAGAQFEPVTATNDGFVLVGMDVDRVAAVWSSSDGEGWDRIGDGPPDWVPRWAGEHLRVHAIVSTGAGLVAGGVTDEGRPAVWTSSDGTTWQSVELPWPLGVTGEVRALTAGPDGVVAFGDGIWMSSDGASWSVAVTTGEGAVPSDAVWDGTEWLGLPSQWGPGDVPLWRSEEGLRWDVAAISTIEGGEATPWHVVWFDDRLVGVGSEIWIARRASP